MMTLQTAEPLSSVLANLYSKPAQELWAQARDNTLDVAPKYQRPSVWTFEQRALLIRSFIIGLPIPAIIINARWRRWRQTAMQEEGGYLTAVIDGRQRLEAIFAWLNGDLAIPASWFPADEVEATEATDDGDYVRINGLRNGARRYGAMWIVPTVEAELATLAEEADMYGTVNTAGTPQTDTDIALAADVARNIR